MLKNLVSSFAEENLMQNAGQSREILNTQIVQ